MPTAQTSVELHTLAQSPMAQLPSTTQPFNPSISVQYNAYRHTAHRCTSSRNDPPWSSNESKPEPPAFDAPKEPTRLDHSYVGHEFNKSRILPGHQPEEFDTEASAFEDRGAEVTGEPANEHLGHDEREPKFAESHNGNAVEPAITAQDVAPASGKQKITLSEYYSRRRVSSLSTKLNDDSPALESRNRLSEMDQRLSLSPSEHPLPEGSENVVDHLVALWTLLPFEDQAK